MKKDGLVKRIEYSKKPPKVEYCLSELGMSMRLILMSLQEWGNDYKKKMNI